MIKVKICGITSPEDALTAVEAGADALGFVFYKESPRHIFPEEAARIINLLPPFVQAVGLFVNEAPEIVNQVSRNCRLGLVQLHGDETPDYCRKIEQRVMKAFRVRSLTCLDPIADYRMSGCLLDAYSPSFYGGTGKSFNWEIAREAMTRGHRIVLAGGLTPDNVAEAIRQVRPYAVDVSSGVESAPGRKDADKVREFIRNAKEAL
ncbi:phosphoribosylanthranilate isomerase [Trichlorobacter lovleyi]|uniref:N-(5'-phosphoribosyl)anthranilate isomerase n=1 Tax=Trichlorobacter lovleyi (strain ATCC BAA-1151 / DSM 17278 / SZ) TaxID=398767 RepID=TRPF_TRIL1|nr:phosphoribosylanthranilate isomerase [Trichlorobacter lovleyi]B3E754.1 RecName: Full=N-(5'-phosphoribosyl)anthranilate isomerase; Short=PRAI [Trichlorobacter lovleyi SZ]ACD94934.1 Phosphoribosylanthranilate isomerase [Trichlorobacter lovleyi SZ]